MLIQPTTQTAPAPNSPQTGLHCADCGTRNSADSKYCKECGAKVSDAHQTRMLSASDLEAVTDHEGQERLAKLLDMAFWHNEAGNWDAALLACEAALVIHPGCTTAHSLLGSLYEKKGDDAKAVAHFESVVALNPDSAADQTKLEQLRRGIHMRPVAAPPPASRWLPPVLSELPAQLTAGGSPIARLRRPSPALASAMTIALVLIGGLLLIRSPKPRGPETIAPAVAPVPLRSVQSGASSAQVTPAPAPAAVNAAAPIVMQGGTSTPIKTAPLPPASVLYPAANAAHADPFTETARPGDALEPLVLPPAAARAPRAVRLAHRTGANGFLPPLSLRAVPLPNMVPGTEGLAPAPVAMPLGAVAPVTASVASVPQHTVVVSSLGGPGGQSALPQNTSGNGGQAPHIRISIHASPGVERISLSDHDVPDRVPSADAPADNGDRYQQSAIALQQQGNFRAARAAYQKAIAAYQAQIAAGRDPQTASAGLAACQTGLQICQQSAP